jgi:putative phosphoesterase
MKWMIASDIHGSAYYCRQMLNAFQKEGADRLLLLGDLLYHGPRNALPQEYDPAQTASMLNEHKNKIVCVQGNCDSQVDQMVLEFPIMAEYALLPVGERLVFATHGHTFHEENVPPLCTGDILLHGHTHVPKCVEHESYIYMNPGSLSIPKEGSAHSYMILENEIFTWKDLEGEILFSYNLLA